jgi:hypothetical protein
MRTPDHVFPLVKFVSMLKKIQQVREHYKTYILDGAGLPVSIEDLKWVIRDIYKIEIVTFEVNYAGEFTRGLVERYSTQARILIRKGMNKRLQRFVAAKEMAHIVIDEPEDWSPRARRPSEKHYLNEQTWLI